MLLGDLVVALVGGSAYESLAPSAWLFAGAGSLFALAQVLIYSRLATGDRRVVVALWTALMVLVGLVLLGLDDSLREIITAALAAGGVLVAAGLLAELGEHRSRPGQPMSAGQPVGR
jgi:hypothetical protein